MVNKSKGLLINYESFIPISSEIVGKTIREVEKKFDLKIDHIHDGPVISDTRRAATPDKVLRFGMTIKICNAKQDVLAKFCKYYDLA